VSLGLEPSPGRGLASVRTVVVVSAALVLLVMQSVIARNWPIRIDAGTLVVVFLALETSFWTGMWTSLIVGYLAGLFSGVPASMDAAVAVAQFVVIRIFVARIVGSRWLLVTTIVVMATSGAIAGRTLVHAVVGADEIPWRLILPAVLGQLGASLVLAWPVFRALQWLQLNLTPRDERG